MWFLLFVLLVNCSGIMVLLFLVFFLCDEWGFIFSVVGSLLSIYGIGVIFGVIVGGVGVFCFGVICIFIVLLGFLMFLFLVLVVV